MISYRFTSLVSGLFVGSIIIYLVRRGHLHIMHSTWWFIVGLICIGLGSFPCLINWIAPILGIHYPPNIILLSCICFFLIKLLNMDIHRSAQEIQIQLLTERIALLEIQLTDINESHEKYDS
ncbi:MAG: DUF2304 domain-containing protein [Candidatus Magnetomorum sp.]|nr:DUF2304 domain-containing protein [Candidatus Magnetomorum sp.]